MFTTGCFIFPKISVCCYENWGEDTIQRNFMSHGTHKWESTWGWRTLNTCHYGTWGYYSVISPLLAPSHSNQLVCHSESFHVLPASHPPALNEALTFPHLCPDSLNCMLPWHSDHSHTHGLFHFLSSLGSNLPLLTLSHTLAHKRKGVRGQFDRSLANWSHI